jgi:hypothetical protein
MIQERSELGQARVIFSPDLEVSLKQARELVAMIQYWSGLKGLTVEWRADCRSPDVQVRAKPEDLERLRARILADMGGFRPLGTPSEPALADRSDRTPRALLVSSDDRMRRLLGMMGSVLGLRCEEAASYAGAEVRVRAQEYDLLIVAGLDIEVDRPGALLAALDPWLGMTTPVILWTEAFVADAAAWMHGLRAPLMLMSRPNDYEDFRDKVQRALEWRHLVRLRRRVDAYVDEKVAERMRALE